MITSFSHRQPKIVYLFYFIPYVSINKGTRRGSKEYAAVNEDSTQRAVKDYGSISTSTRRGSRDRRGSKDISTARTMKEF